MPRGAPLLALVLGLLGCTGRPALEDMPPPVWPDFGARDRAPSPEQRPDLAVPDQPLPPDSAAEAGEAGADAPPAAGWVQVGVPTTLDLHQVACVGGHVFAVGDQGTVLHRAPGAGSFAKQDPGTTSDLYTVTFADASYGVIAGKDPKIWQTVDLGAGWTVAPQCSAFVFEAFHALHLHSATEGFGAGIAVSNQGAGYKTFSGYSWVCGPTPYPGEVFHGVYRLAHLGWIVGETGGHIYRTEDNGASWTAVPAGSSQALLAVAFSGSSLGVAVGRGGAIVRSTDGAGATWTAVSSPTQEDLHALSWGGPQGWAVGQSGTILTSSNAGQSWTAQPSPTSARLEGICFSSATEGWAVGQGGVVLHTQTGGI